MGIIDETIELTIQHRGGTKSYSFSGRSNGEQVRKILDLDSKDFDEKNYRFTMPKDTTSFNPSFYLGLLFKSVINLNGVDCFKKKYYFDFDTIEEEFRPYIEKDFSECERKARNEFFNLSS